MFDIKKILQRSWHILWSYRVLWIFGFMLAMASSGGRVGNNSSYSANDGDNRPSVESPGDWEGFKSENFAEEMKNAFQQAGTEIQKLQEQYPIEFQMGIAAAITLFVVIFVLSIITTILRYVAETSTIRMVDEYEQNGVKVGFRQGWKYGWSREAWRLFLTNLIVHIPSFVLFVILVMIGWWIFSALLSGTESTTIISYAIAGTGLAFLSIFFTAILMAILYILRDFAWRMIVLEGQGVTESLRNATAMVKHQWKNVGLMWLVMIGVNIAFGIAFVILVLPLLAFSLITALGGIAAAAIPSLLTAGIASVFSAPEYWPWIFAAIVGLPFFFIVTFSPLILVGGWGAIYQSSVWTLTYRELKALETIAPAAPAIEQTASENG